MVKRIIIIGGGIHGCATAVELSDIDYEIMLIEKADELFQGTSGSTHNRAHMGYHYPRAIDTAKECQEGLDHFKTLFNDALISSFENYYVISKVDSMTNKDQFRGFCNELKLPYKIRWPDKQFLHKDLISSSFLVPEGIFNTERIIDYFKKHASKGNIIFKTNTEVVKGNKIADNQFKVVVNEHGEINEYKADIIINATYAYANNVLKAFGMEQQMKEYKQQKVEVVVVRSRKKIPALTVMDGPFMSIMPYGNFADLYLLYDVENSVVHQEKGFLVDDTIEYKSKWEKMRDKGRAYFPFIGNLDYVCSKWAYRPIPLNDDTRARSTKIKSYNKYRGFYSILEGKFISAPIMAMKLKEIIMANLATSNTSLISIPTPIKAPECQSVNL